MRLTLSFFFCLLLTATWFAQSPSKIISQANKALGGEKTLKAVSSWQQTGKITRVSDGAAGNYSVISSGGMYGGMYDLNGFEVAFGYNGKSGWMRDSKTGLRTVTGDASKEFQAEAAYRNSRWLKAKDEKAKLTSGGTSTVGGKPANVVLLTTAKAVRIKLFFDTVSGLLLREEVPQGGKSFEYSDYRAVNGVQTPYAIKLADGEETYDIKLDDVKYNVAVARSSFDFPKMSSEALPDIPTLLNDIRANADKVEAILENYNYTETRTDRDLKDNGELVEKWSMKHLLTFYKGHRIKRLIERNGRPLSPGDQAKEDKDAEKEVADIEKRAAEKEKKQLAQGARSQPQKEENPRFTVAEALKGSLLINARRERFKGGDVIVFDYEPDPAFKPKSLNQKIFALCTGAVWVDPVKKQVVRMEATLTKTSGNFIAKAKRGASFTIDNELVNHEIWLPARFDINMTVKILFAGITLNSLVKYADYKRFETEVKDATVGDEKKP
jgi:hypothetical protein